MVTMTNRETRSLSGLEENFETHRAAFESLNRAWVRLVQRHSKSLSEKPRMGLTPEQVERIASIGPTEADRLCRLDFPLVAHRTRDTRSWSTCKDAERADWRQLASASFVAIGNIIRSHGISSRLLLGATCGCEGALGANPLTTLDDGDASECRMYCRLSPAALTFLLEGLDGSDDLWLSARRQAHAAIQTPYKCDCTRKN